MEIFKPDSGRMEIKMKLKKIFTAFLCAGAAAILLSACENGSGSSDEMYYGQAVKEVNADIYRIYDGRFLSDEEMDAVANYFYSVQTKDSQLFSTLQPEFYIDHFKKDDPQYIDSFLSDYYQTESEDLGGDFIYTQIEVTDCGGEDKDAGLTDILDSLGNFYEEETGGSKKDFLNTVKDAKFIRYAISASPAGSPEEEYTLSDQIMYVINYDGGIYVF